MTDLTKYFHKKRYQTNKYDNEIYTRNPLLKFKISEIKEKRHAELIKQKAALVMNEVNIHYVCVADVRFTFAGENSNMSSIAIDGHRRRRHTGARKDLHRKDPSICSRIEKSRSAEVHRTEILGLCAVALASQISEYR